MFESCLENWDMDILKRETFVYVHIIYLVKCASTEQKSEYKLF